MGLRTWLGLKKKRIETPPIPRSPVADVLWQRAAETGADFIEPLLASAILFKSRQDIRRFALEEIPKDGLLLEFGVFEAESINPFADALTAAGDARPIYGFDAFKGLQEHWNGIGYHRVWNHFNRGGRLPEVRDNVRLVPGWIDDTLPPFLAENKGPIGFVHIDTDTYLPAKAILQLCKDRFRSGTVILFDELLCYPGWQHGEYKALTEEIQADTYEWLAFSGQQALLRFR